MVLWVRKIEHFNTKLKMADTQNGQHKKIIMPHPNLKRQSLDFVWSNSLEVVSKNGKFSYLSSSDTVTTNIVHSVWDDNVAHNVWCQISKALQRYILKIILHHAINFVDALRVWCIN